MLKIIDSHVHMDSIERAALESMALAGVEAVIADGSPMPGLAPSPQTIFDFYERTLGYEAIRGEEFIIDVYAMIGINMFFVPQDYKAVFKEFPAYLIREKVVGIGEIGMEPRSKTCPDLKTQQDLLEFFLMMAKEYDKTILFHTPSTDREKWVEFYFKLIEEAKIDPIKVVLSHADSSIIKMIQEFGCVAGVTVQPWRDINAAEAVKIIEGNDLDRIVIDSDSSLRFGSDVLSVPKTALEMRKLGFKETDIQKVVYDNAVKVFNLNPETEKVLS